MSAPARTHPMERLGITFIAVMAANLMTALIVGLSVRYYIRWSVQDSVEKFQTGMKQTQSPGKTP